MHIKKISDSKYFLRITKDELTVQHIIEFCEQERIHFGYVTAIGALTDPTIAYYDLNQKEYLWKDFPGTFEVVSLIGNIALVDDNPFLHAHLILSDKNYNTFGGHLKEGKSGATLEVMVEKFEGNIERHLDQETGLKLLELD